MRPHRLLLAALLALTASCVAQTKLLPVPGTAVSPEGPSVGEGEGVRLLADGDAWRGYPSTLEHYVTPVLVRIENKSGRPLRLQHPLFELVGESQFHYSALSSSDMGRQGLAVTRAYPSASLGWGWGWGGGGWGPYSHWWGAGGWGPGWWGSGFYYDPFFYAPAPYYYVEPLPSHDMLQRALPEGRLDAGGSISGFLYFQDVGTRERFVNLQYRLVDADTGEDFGTVSIPFQVKR